MARPKKSSKKNNIFNSTSSYLDKIEAEVQSNQSRVSYVLGILIVIVASVLLFNYFNKNKAELGSAQNTQTEDVTPDKLPGGYTVKDGDTLFTIAEKYYQDGFKYPEIAKANNMLNVDSIETGQVITIPKLEAVPSPTPSETPTPQPTIGKPTGTQWGPAITQNTYTVVDGDWLSKIADRAYGDVTAYDKIAKANNISNPDVIEVGQVLTIPR